MKKYLFIISKILGYGLMTGLLLVIMFSGGIGLVTILLLLCYCISIGLLFSKYKYKKYLPIGILIIAMIFAFTRFGSPCYLDPGKLSNTYKCNCIGLTQYKNGILSGERSSTCWGKRTNCYKGYDDNEIDCKLLDDKYYKLK